MVIKKGILNKLYVIVVLMALFFVVIVFRIFELQFLDGDKYRKLSLAKTHRNDTIFANRGNVYASDGNLLATSMSKFTVRMDVMSVKSRVFEKNIKLLLTRLQIKYGIATKLKLNHPFLNVFVGFMNGLKTKRRPMQS